MTHPRSPQSSTSRAQRVRALAGLAVLSLLMTAPVQAADPQVLAAEAARVKVLETISPSVVAVFSATGDGGGSGVLITPDGYALTNFHVTNGSGNFMKCGLNDGRLYDAVIVGIDPTGDVALIKLLGRDDFPVAAMGDSDAVQVGDWVYAIGNPFLLATDFTPTVTYGIVSGTHRYQYPAGTILEYTDCIQVDASINPGNSGGPLFSDDGKLIGINGRGSFEKRGRVNSGAGYAISINQIKHFMGHLRSGRIVDHATLGATVRTGEGRSVLVDRVLENSPAWRRGLRDDDEVISFAGRPIGSVNQFKNILGIYPRGWSVPLVYRRDGQKHEVLVELQGVHQESEFVKKSGPEAPTPKPDDPKDPKPKKPGENPEKEPKLPPNHPLMKKAPKPPKEYAHLFVEKPGFANYYFNQQEQQRLAAGLQEFSSWQGQTGRWKLTGTLATGEDFTWTMAPQGLGLRAGEIAAIQALDGSELLDEPKGSGGLLVAMAQLRQLLMSGPASFTQTYYLGTQPLAGVEGLVDVLITVQTGVETRWYFRPGDARLLGWDSRLTRDSDPAEIRLGEPGTFDGRPFPTSWTARRAGQDVATFQLKKIEVAPADASASASK